MAYKTLILDFDGTLADTRQSILQSMQFVAQKLGTGQVDEELIKDLIGLPLKTTFEKALSLDEKSIEHATQLYRGHYNEIAIDTIALFEGVKDTLLALNRQGIRLTVASSKGKVSLIKILQKHQVLELFSFVGGEEDARTKKPSPEIVLRIMNEFRYKPDECLVVGDTVYDIEMGQRAKVATCGVTYGNNTRAALEAQGADHTIDHFALLLDLV